MTATAFIDGIKKMPSLLPLQAQQLINLAPHMNDKQRADTFATVKKEHEKIEANVKEGEQIMDKVEKETQAIYKKEWPKVKDAIEKEESSGAASTLEKQIGAA